MDLNEAFHIAAFAPDGQMVGRDVWRFDRLSAKWLEICESMLDELGPVIDHQWSEPLSYLRTKLTSAHGCALGTSYIRDQVTASFLLLFSTQDDAVEQEVRSMFVRSLTSTRLVQDYAREAGVETPFLEVAHLTDRPLMVVVTFEPDAPSAQELDVGRELTLHAAAAFFRRQLNGAQNANA